jgi:hypothetical protein
MDRALLCNNWIASREALPIGLLEEREQKEREKQWEKELRRLQNATDLKIPRRSKNTRSKPQKEVKIYIDLLESDFKLS